LVHFLLFLFGRHAAAQVDVNGPTELWRLSTVRTWARGGVDEMLMKKKTGQSFLL
jgi:hypothetical protein